MPYIWKLAGNLAARHGGWGRRWLSSEATVLELRDVTSRLPDGETG